MRRLLATARLVMGIAWEADRSRYVQMAVLAMVSPFGAFGVAVATAMMVDAAAQTDVSRALIAAGVALPKPLAIATPPPAIFHPLEPRIGDSLRGDLLRRICLVTI